MTTASLSRGDAIEFGRLALEQPAIDSPPFVQYPAPRPRKETAVPASLHERHQPFPEFQAQQPQAQHGLQRGRCNR